MTRKRRVYIIRKSHEPIEEDAYSSLTKVSEELEVDLSYKALAQRLRTAKILTGKSLIRLKDENGNPITIEIKDVK